MNIYLACTVRGDRGAVVVLREVADLLDRAGHTVLTRHPLEDDVDSADATLSEREVFARDMAWLSAADVLIAEASGSSYGVGFEVGYVLGSSAMTDQRVLLLYSEGRRSAVSRLIVGTDHPRCHVHSYVDAGDVIATVTGFLAHEATT